MSEETTISVRGIDMKTWKEFQKAIIDQYGNLYGYIGPELTKALGYWLERRAGTSVPGTTRPDATPTDEGVERHYVGPGPAVFTTNAARIREAMTHFGGEATIQQVCSYLNEKYPGLNQGSISTSMSDLSINGPPSSLYSEDKKFLQRVARGRYRLVRERLS
jgi:hypothetical protein